MKTKHADTAAETGGRAGKSCSVTQKLSLCLLVGAVLATSMPAAAGPFDERHDRHERHFQPDRGARHFSNRPQPQRHHHHHGHNAAWGVLGAGIALGAVALAVEAPRPPVVVSPIAAPIAAPAARPPGAWWYFCESAGAYYPYVNHCAEGWRAVPATSYGY